MAVAPALVALACCLCAVVTEGLADETYSEQTSFITLADGSVLFRVEPRFDARPVAHDHRGKLKDGAFGETPRGAHAPNATANDCAQHSSLVPLPVRRIFEATGAEAVSVRLTQGRWRDDAWGAYPYEQQTPMMGAEVEATWPSALRASVPDRFEQLMHMLSGMLCASLSTITAEHVIYDTALFTSGSSDSPTTTVRGFLQREALCTENLTPLQHLLPCGRIAGLASLIDARKFFSGSFHSLGWSARRAHRQLAISQRPSPVVCAGDVSMHVTIEAVAADHTRAVPLSLARSSEHATLESIDLGRFYNTRTWRQRAWCAAADVTTFVIDTRQQLHRVHVNAEHQGFARVDSDGGALAAPDVPLAVTKVYIGRGTYKGAISTRIHNNWDTAIAAYNDTFVPAKARVRPAHLTTWTTVPAHTTLELRIAFHHGFLRSSDYPSDPFRGLEVLPTIVLADVFENHTSRFISNPLAIHMAVPDMSMPFNVIMLTSTLVAIIFSMLLTLASNLRLPTIKI
ncbi:hypothetical protein PTSG_08058 [Salpingoeca rosetta]|uniref:GPI transamidase component PIG-T n=1 Tax=Salpingoeca rosetta (strain ATCC 50818 / BSB-021) TaxID=946362 RepID=F2UHV8_SALR5|nr:uncharacterized protein PTSG_08058 [Salpingoeca rosetta]EGD76707.1 hypothetical protein PTSG_08058 [Salpingoeca rosetta]|eukprot:XP_004991079.1 hypothetical protein PTSG_08058 [Salpingoeca rosetta]